jgi:hypothetical protein
MRPVFILVFSIFFYAAAAQNSTTEAFTKDSLIIIRKDPAKGFCNDYILFIPRKTPLNKEIVLLVESNNTGKLSDSVEVHENAAIALASLSSVGNNISTELHIPLLVPIFPRPASQPLMYTHALDRDVMEATAPEFKRLDLQLLAMVKDANAVLSAMNIKVAPKFFMSGFSASGTFTNRFSFLHPDKIKALAMGGFNGELMLPQDKLNGIKFNYPLGTNDFQKLFGQPFDIKKYKAIPQFIYLGRLDENDAVQYDDAYSEAERKIINENLGSDVQGRYLKCQEIYKKDGIDPIFKSYEKIGHWTTPDVNLEVIMFFYKQMQSDESKSPAEK